MLKQCTVCRELKPLEDFHRNRAMADGRTPQCSECHLIIARETRMRYRGRFLIRGAKMRCRKSGVVFALDNYEAEIDAMLEKGCALTGLPFNPTPLPRYDSPSLDRIKPSLGYVPGNVRVILYCLNAALGNWGEDVFATVATAFVEQRKSFPC